MAVTALVLCGGSSRRLGRDKLAEPLGSSTVLDVTLAGLPAAWPVVCVGPDRPTVRPVTWTVEQPPGGGPVPAIAAGLALVTTAVVVVIAGDMPFAGPWAVRLADAVAATPTQAVDTVDAVAARDGDDRLNPLLCAYRTASLRAAMPQDPAGRPAQQLLLGLPHDTLRVPGVDAVDVDTAEALAAARRRVGP